MTLGKTLLGVIHVLVGKLDLVSQRLLELIEVVLVGGLSFCCCVELGLALLQETVQGVNDATAGRDSLKQGHRGRVTLVLSCNA